MTAAPRTIVVSCVDEVDLFNDGLREQDSQLDPHKLTNPGWQDV